MPRTLYRPNQAFVTVDPDGVKIVFSPDPSLGIALVPEGHWVLKGRESLFDPIGQELPESATAAPGEKRPVRRRKD